MFTWIAFFPFNPHNNLLGKIISILHLKKLKLRGLALRITVVNQQSPDPDLTLSLNDSTDGRAPTQGAGIETFLGRHFIHAFERSDSL